MHEDGSDFAWRQLLKDAADETLRVAIEGQKHVQVQLKALDVLLQADKLEDVSVEEHEEALVQARKSQAWLQEELEDYRQHQANIQVHFKGLFEGLAEEEARKWQALKEANKKLKSSRFVVLEDEAKGSKA